MNEYLVEIPIEEVYEREFAEALKDYNDKQKRKDRKIDNYYEHICNSKRHMPQQEIIFQVGEHKDFIHQENRDMAKNILREHFERFQKDNPNLKIYNAVIHDDEATPHLHINFVPIADGYKRGLKKQVSFDRALIQQEPSLNQEQPFTEWRAEQVTQLEKALNDNNIDRKIVGTFDYKNQKEFKLKQDLEQEILCLRAEKHDVEQNVGQEQEKLGTLEARVERLDKISNRTVENARNFVKSTTSAVKPAILNKEMVQIPKKDLDNLTNSFISLAESNVHARTDHKKMEKQNEIIKNDMRNNNEVINDLKFRNNFLARKLQERDEKIEDLNYDVQILDTFNTIHSVFRDTIRTHHDVIQKVIDKLPLIKEYKDLLKGYVSATLTDRNLKEAQEVALDSLTNDHNSTLKIYSIGSTVKEHVDLKIADKRKEQEITRPKSRCASL